MMITQTELIEYRFRLQRKYAELVDGRRSRGALAIEPAADEADQSKGAQQRDMAIGGFDRDSKLLHDVRSALARTAAGKFGICIDCEGDIGWKRLGAIPWATSCIVCQTEADSRAGEPFAMEESLVRVA